jgi:hypothetical protein
VSHLRVVLIAFVVRWATLLFALANRATWVFPQNVDLNVFRAQNALRRKLVTTLSVRILVRERAAETPSVAWLITIQSVSVHQDGPEIL